MLDKRTYFKFSSKVNKLLKTSFLGTEEPDSSEDCAVLYGFSPYTKSKNYYYSKSIALRQKNELLDICKMLPKHDLVSGTAGTILYTDMLSDTSDPTLLKQQMDLADKFSHLLVVSQIGNYMRLDRENPDKSFLNINILPHYRKFIYESKVPQEPDEK